MQYRLGEFTPNPDLSAFYGRILEAMRRPGVSTQDLVQMLATPPESTPEAPDLLETLRHEGVGDDAWLFDAVDALREMRQRGRAVQLQACEWQGGSAGHLTLTVSDRSLGAFVRRGDQLMAGFAAVRAPHGDVEIMPRLFRKVCENGAILFTHQAEDVMGSMQDVGAAIELCMSPATTERAVEVLRRAARTGVADPLALLEAAALPIDAGAVLAGREDADDTVFGAINALTAHARAEPDLTRRIELERGAERILIGAGLLPSPTASPRRRPANRALRPLAL